LRSFTRQLAVLSLVLAVPIVPFVLWGDSLEHWIRNEALEQLPKWHVGLATIGLLATDIFLPIPSSFVSTYAGARLGAVEATAASWLGMSLGACLAFWLARTWGKPLVLRLSKPDELARMQDLIQRYGAAGLVIVRPLPVLAEASVLLFGMHGLSWNRFLPAVLASNFVIAGLYSAFGRLASHHHWLSWALCISLLLPFILTIGLKSCFARVETSKETETDERSKFVSPE
jgi:uncharacterized membrane protein YdjX (TVP38/TMEM64 family)